jgi:hypothetical protein
MMKKDSTSPSFPRPLIPNAKMAAALGVAPFFTLALVQADNRSRPHTRTLHGS